MNLVRSELTEHKKVLEAFRDLPKELKKKILTFYRTEYRIDICPECGQGCFKVLVPVRNYFQCSHNYYPISAVEK